MIEASLFHNFLTQNFGLPSGGLYSNLIASALLGTGAFIYGRAFEKRAEKRDDKMKDHISAEHDKSRKHLENMLSRNKN